MQFMSTLIRYTTGVIVAMRSAAAIIEKPNLVIIMTDEHNLKTLGCYRSQLSKPFVWGEGVKVDTPNIDSLANDGAIFTNFNVITPICTPSRASFMSGLYPWFTGATENHSAMNTNVTTFAKILQDKRDYYTGYVGKWHLNGDEKPGFSNDERPFGFNDIKYQFNRGHWKLFEEDMQTGEISAYDWKKKKKISGALNDAYATDFLFNKGIDFMATQIDDEKPFALMLSIPDPHGPNDVRPPYDTMYNDMNFKMPPSGVAAFKRKPALPSWSHVKSKVEYDLETANETIKNIENDDKWQTTMRNYFGMVKLVDDKVGELLSFLKKKGQDSNTIVVFTSNHGDLLGEHGKYNKGKPYQTSAGVPFIIRYPNRVRKSKVIKTAYSSPDVALTILSLMGVDYSEFMLQGIDGSDELLSDNKTNKRSTVRFITDSKDSKWAAAVDRQYKLVLSWGEPWLFDLKKDPDEMINYSSDSSYSTIMKKLQNELINAMEQYKLSLVNKNTVYIDPLPCSDIKDQMPDSLPYRVCEDLRRDKYAQACLDEKARNVCPRTCSSCCEDSIGKMYHRGTIRDCGYVKKRKERKCTNPRVKEFCPFTCSTCIPEPNNRPPTQLPTDTPSISSPAQQATDAQSSLYVAQTI